MMREDEAEIPTAWNNPRTTVDGQDLDRDGASIYIISMPGTPASFLARSRVRHHRSWLGTPSEFIVQK